MRPAAQRPWRPFGCDVEEGSSKRPGTASLYVRGQVALPPGPVAALRLSQSALRGSIGVGSCGLTVSVTVCHCTSLGLASIGPISCWKRPKDSVA